MKNDDQERAESEPRTQTEKEGKQAENEAAPTKPRYEFKILPVDPKNSFDFEDVADK